MKTFEGDFNIFLNKIKNNEHFSLSRWGDGELKIIEGNPIDIRDKGNGEFRYDPTLSEYTEVRKKMIESYSFNDNNYYIGIACPCCVGVEKNEYMKKMSHQTEDKLTWANIFVNSNYKKTLNEFIPELKNHSVTLVINKNSNIDKLPFKPNNVYYIGIDAWLEDYYIIQKLIDLVKENNIENELFLFAAGPLANMLTYSLWKYGSKKNTYIDIGSILDPYLDLKITRGYQLGRPTINKTCTW